MTQAQYWKYRLWLLVALAVVLAACADNDEGITTAKSPITYAKPSKPPGKPIQCPDGSTVKPPATCPTTPPPTQTCPDGSVIPATDTCPVVPPPTQTCPDGSVIPATEVCPAPPPTMQTCYDGTVIPILETCPTPPPPMQTCWDGSVIPATDVCPPIVEPPVPADGWVNYPLTEPHHALNRARYARATQACEGIYGGPPLVAGSIYRIHGYGAAGWTDGVYRNHWTVLLEGAGEATATNTTTVLTECLIGVHREGITLDIWTMPENY